MTPPHLSQLKWLLASLALLPGVVAAQGVGHGGGPPAGFAPPGLSMGARGFPSLPTEAQDTPAASASAHGLATAENAAARGQQAVAAARHEHYRELQKRSAGQLDFDPKGALIRGGEITAVPSSSQAIANALASGFVEQRASRLAGLDIAVTVLSPPPGLSLRRALRQLRRADPRGAYDYNHLYFESASNVAGESAATARDAGPSAAAGLRLGMIDGGVAESHPLLRGTRVHVHGCGGNVVPSVHGTEIASLLAPDGGDELYAADVYCGTETGASTEALLEAIGWLVDERVPVINISLVGPRNALLERAVDVAAQRGFLLVAAVGNDGPAAAPLYPAAYPPVVAVTGVDADHRVLLEAGRGDYVRFAALGAGLSAAIPQASLTPVRGTSFAAPQVARRLAELLPHPDLQLANRAIELLAASAIDLGRRGEDPVYGYGFVDAKAAIPAGRLARSH